MKNKLFKVTMLLFFFIGTFSCKNPSQEIKTIEPNPAPVVYNNVKELVLATKKEITQISPEQLKAQLKNGEIYVIDVREKATYDKGNIPGSVLIPRGLLEFKIAKDVYWNDKNLKMPNKDQKIIVYCKSGGRGSLATRSLNQLGYKNAINLEGGYEGWIKKYPNDIYVPKVK